MTLAEKSNNHLQKEEAACWVNNFEYAIKSLNHAVKVFLSPTWLLHISLLFFVAVVVFFFQIDSPCCLVFNLTLW